MSIVAITSPDTDEQTARWARWEGKYAASSRRGAIQARIAFAILLIVTSGWVALQLLSLPAVP